MAKTNAVGYLGYALNHFSTKSANEIKTPASVLNKTQLHMAFSTQCVRLGELAEQLRYVAASDCGWSP
jgi:hypothetical protein